MNLERPTCNHFLFGVYPYICLAVFLLGSLIRFDRDQYTWKSDSSQLLRAGTLRWGSNLFHVGILFLFFGHSRRPADAAWVYEPFIGAPAEAAAWRSSRAASPGSSLRRASPCCCIGASFDPRIRSPATDRHRDPRHPVAAARPRPGHDPVSRRSTSTARDDADPGRLGAAHRHLPPRRRRADRRRRWRVQGAHDPRA